MTTKRLLLALALLSLCQTADAVTGYGQPIMSGSGSLDAAATEYNVLYGDASWQADEDRRYQIVPANGTFVGACISLATAPQNGAGTQSYTFTLRQGASESTLSDTSMTITISEDDKYGCDQTNAVAYTPGQKVSWKVVPANTPAVGAIASVAWFVPDTPGQQIFMAASQSSSMPNNADRYFQLGGEIVRDDAESEVYCIHGLGGTVSAIYVETDTAPTGAGKETNWTLRDCGPYTSISCADSAATVQLSNTEISDSWTGSVTIHAEDVVTMEYHPVNTPTVPTTMHWGIRIDMTDPSTFVSFMAWDDDLSASVTEYQSINDISAWGTEAASQTMGFRMVQTGIWVALDADPGTSPDAYTFGTRADNDFDGTLSDTSCLVSIVANATTGEKTDCLDEFRHPTLASVYVTPVSTPSVTVIDGAIGFAWKHIRRIH